MFAHNAMVDAKKRVRYAVLILLGKSMARKERGLTMPHPGTFIDTLSLWFCRLGFAGLSPVMPGTCGTFVAALLAPFVFLPLPIWLRGVVLLLLFFLGGMAANRAERVLGRSDPGEVVIDELIGLWIVLLPFKEPSWQLMLCAFVLFRFFDMAKPWPVNVSETWLDGGFGIMIDDVVAGVMALACVWVLFWLGFFQ